MCLHSYAFQVVEAEIPALRRAHRQTLQREYDDYRRRMDDLHSSRDSAESADAAGMHGVPFWQRFFKRQSALLAISSFCLFVLFRGELVLVLFWVLLNTDTHTLYLSHSHTHTHTHTHKHTHKYTHKHTHTQAHTHIAL